MIYTINPDESIESIHARVVMRSIILFNYKVDTVGAFFMDLVCSFMFVECPSVMSRNQVLRCSLISMERSLGLRPYPKGLMFTPYGARYKNGQNRANNSNVTGVLITIKLLANRILYYNESGDET